MNKKIITLSVLVLFLTFCAKKGNNGNLESGVNSEIADPTANTFKKNDIVSENLETYNPNNPAVGYFQFIKHYQKGGFVGGNQQPFPNGDFTEWEDHCWLWGRYLDKENSATFNLLASSRLEFMQLFELDRLDCNNDQEVAAITDVPEKRKFIARQKSLRLTPKHFLNARYAQLYIPRETGNRYYFNGATFTYGTSEETVSDRGLIKPLEGGNGVAYKGVVLKNVSGSLGVVVNGQITSGIPRADGTGPSYGFVETVYNVSEGLGNTPFTARPNKLKVELKYAPNKNSKGPDKATIEVMLHGSQSGVRLPCKTKFEMDKQENKNKDINSLVCDNALAYVRLVVDKATDWVTLEVPIYYKNEDVQPAYFLSNISAGFEYGAITGSILSIRSLQFIY